MQRILILDDHLLFAEGLELLLTQLGEHIQITVANESSHVLADIERLNQYDLLLVDLKMPGVDGFNLLRAIRAQKVPLNVLVVSGTENRSEVEQAIRLGAIGFISKDSPKQDMLIGVREALAGRRFLPSWYDEDANDAGNEQASTNPFRQISPKQIEVLTMMERGLQNQQMATIMGVSVSAINRHVESLFRSLDVKNRTACVQMAIKHGLISSK